MIEAREPVTWYHDLCGCLHSTVGGILAAEREDPVATLGAAWRFERLDEWEPVEFAWPAHGGDLSATLAPYHDLTIVWHDPPDEREAEREILERLAGERPAIVAVDNFYLPFRPAWHDVHAGHLIVVFGFDDGAGVFLVHDAVPPAYRGPLAQTDLRASRGSPNLDDGDSFFAGRPIGHRWIEVAVDAPSGPLDDERIAAVLKANLAHFHDGNGSAPGLAAAHTYLEELVDRARAEDSAALREAYGFGWIPQASAALHADFLALAGTASGRPELREAGRAVEKVAHSWTPIRVGAAHGVEEPAPTSAYLRSWSGRLVRDYEAALDAVERALEAVEAP